MGGKSSNKQNQNRMIPSPDYTVEPEMNQNGSKNHYFRLHSKNTTWQCSQCFTNRIAGGPTPLLRKWQSNPLPGRGPVDWTPTVTWWGGIPVKRSHWINSFFFQGVLQSWAKAMTFKMGNDVMHFSQRKLCAFVVGKVTAGSLLEEKSKSVVFKRFFENWEMPLIAKIFICNLCVLFAKPEPCEENI